LRNAILETSAELCAHDVQIRHLLGDFGLEPSSLVHFLLPASSMIHDERLRIHDLEQFESLLQQ